VCSSSRGIIRRVRLIFWEVGELRFASQWRIICNPGGGGSVEGTGRRAFLGGVPLADGGLAP